MATIQSRKRADGTTAYRAIIRIKKHGEIVHSESETFGKKRDAEIWSKKREATLSEPGAIDREKKTAQTEVTLKDLIERYEQVVKPVKPWGRSKQFVLESWKNRDEGGVPVLAIDSAWLIEYCRMRRVEEQASASTVNHDIAHLRTVFSVAKDMLSVDVTVQPFDEARPTLSKLDLASKSGERDRRVKLDEINAILSYAHKRKRTKVKLR